MSQALPTRVQEQLRAAEALEAQEQAARAGVAQAHPAVKSAADLVLQTPPVPAASAPPQAAAPAQPPAPTEESFEQKYKTLQGKYNAEVVPLRRQAQESDRRLNELAQQLRGLTEAKTAAPTTPAPADPKDVETFGADMLEMVSRLASSKAQEVVAEVVRRLDALEGKVTGVTEQTAASLEQQFYTLLGKLVPDWQAINVDDRWLSWLGQVDEVYGVPRQKALDHAFSALDAQRVSNVFKAFVATLPVAPKPESLRDQVTPEGAGTVVTPTAASKPILSEKAITAFYRDVSRGAYKGREAEADSIEAQINLAVAEGRVR